MSRKGFLVKVEVEIQRVTCPGVWLCSNGKVSLQLHMLDSSVQTDSKKPTFPIACRERFVFYKAFPRERRLNELQRSLDAEWLRAELVQWRSCEEGRVLATFDATLDDVLYPAAVRGTVAGANLDLLMEPTTFFPGAIAPKLEISTKTTIEETFCDLDEHSSPDTAVVNPKTLICNPAPVNGRRNKPRKVCHSIAYSRARCKYLGKCKKSRPIFKYQRPEDDLILRTNPNRVLKEDNYTPTKFFRRTPENSIMKHGSDRRPLCSCYCKVKSNGMENGQSYSKVIRISLEDGNDERTGEICACGKMHKEFSCPICVKYEGYFSSNGSKERTSLKKHASAPAGCQRCRTRKHLRSSNGSPCPSDDGSGTTSKLKACVCASAASAADCASRARSLARELHERVCRTIKTNSQLLDDVGCANYGRD